MQGIFTKSESHPGAEKPNPGQSFRKRSVWQKAIETASLVPLRVYFEQVRSLRQRNVADAKKVIIFLVPVGDRITGGILSIFNLYRFSNELTAVHNAKVLMCFFPGEGAFTCRHKLFENDVTIYPFDLVLATLERVKELQIHIPEYAIQRVLMRIGPKRLAQLRLTHGLRVNILNQNILAMPSDAFLKQIQQILPQGLTCTTAHPSYTTPEFRNRCGIPVHHLPAWTYPDDAPASGYESKRDLLIISPDPSPYRQIVLREIAARMPRLEMHVVSGMRFEHYLKLVREAKWSLTFGEGMDDYFIGTFYRGGIGFAVYNDDFFTREFKAIRTVYPNWEMLAASIIEEITALDNKESMESFNAQVRPLLSRIWSRKNTITALESFYLGKFTLP